MKRILLKNKIFIFIILLFSVASCGVKGNPVDPSRVTGHAEMVKNLKVAASGDSLKLTWDLQDNDARINYINIERRESGDDEKDCRDCTGTFERVGQIQVKKVKKENQDNEKFIFTDKNATRGKSYDYRLSLCDDFKSCFESAVTAINFK